MVHLLFQCQHSWALWNDVVKLIEQVFNTRVFVSLKTIIFNSIHESRIHVANLVCLITKQYIYSKRCLKQSLEFFECKNIILNTRNIEKYIAIKNGNIEKHQRKWAKNNEVRESQHQHNELNNYIVNYLTDL